MKQEQIHKPKPKETHQERRQREERERQESERVPESRSKDASDEVEEANETLEDIDRLLGELVLTNVGTENPGNNE